MIKNSFKKLDRRGFSDCRYGVQHLIKKLHRYGKSKKDLDNLLKILFDVLSSNMKNGQDYLPGLGLMKDDTFVYKIKCEKKENSKKREGFDLKILRQVGLANNLNPEHEILSMVEIRENDELTNRFRYW